MTRLDVLIELLGLSSDSTYDYTNIVAGQFLDKPGFDARSLTMDEWFLVKSLLQDKVYSKAKLFGYLNTGG